MSHAIYCSDFSDLTIDGFFGAPAQPELAAIELVNGKRAMLKDLYGSDPRARLVRQVNVGQ
jgi:hypothetical protein